MLVLIAFFCFVSVVAILTYIALVKWIETQVSENYGLRLWEECRQIGNECAGYRKTPTPVPRSECRS